jgi:outer membrane protein OmpU
MNKFKKIGLTALAGSLVATTAFAGEMSVNGNASLTAKNNNGVDGGKSFTMGNQLTFTGGGELDNGLNVALSFVLDHGDNVASGFDSHSIKISSDALGTFTFAGDGTGNAQSALDTTAAGDIWDNGFKYTAVAGSPQVAYTAMAGSDASTSSINYTLPTIMDDLSVSASYSAGGAAVEATTAMAATYTGVEGLSLSYGVGEAGSTDTTKSGDVTTYKGSYAMGSFTVAYSNTESDKDTGTDEEMTSWKLSYSVTDDLSVTYGEEAHETAGQSTDEEFEAITVSYTTGGMTLTAGQYDASGLGNDSADKAERWKLGASFAF